MSNHNWGWPPRHTPEYDERCRQEALRARRRGLRSDNTSGLKGVSRHRNGWQARLLAPWGSYTKNFTDKEEAARWYDQQVREQFGPDATTNESLGLLSPPTRTPTSGNSAAGTGSSSGTS